MKKGILYVHKRDSHRQTFNKKMEKLDLVMLKLNGTNVLL